MQHCLHELCLDQQIRLCCFQNEDGAFCCALGWLQHSDSAAKLISSYLMHADLALMKCLSQPPRLAKSQQGQHLHGHRGERPPVRCSAAHPDEDTSSSASKQHLRPEDATVSRRHALLAATCACIAARCAPAEAAIIDEAQAQEIFEQVSDSVVSIANVKQTGKQG